MKKTNKTYSKEFIKTLLGEYEFLSPLRTQKIVGGLTDIIIEHVDIESLSEEERDAFEGACFYYIEPEDYLSEDIKTFEWVKDILKDIGSRNEG